MKFLFKKNDQKQENEPIIFRLLRKSDLPALEWNGEYTHFRRLFEASHHSATQGRSVLWVVEKPKVGIIGQLFVQLHSSRPELADGISRAYIYGFRIQSAYRDQGIGTRLMKTAEDDLRTRGFTRVTLNVGRDNYLALQLYERLGYKIIAPEPGIWSYQDHEGNHHQVNEPSWRMEKELVELDTL
jgi:ribosomal protein S18 acetylase RimI-like enzyme